MNDMLMPVRASATRALGETRRAERARDDEPPAAFSTVLAEAMGPRERVEEPEAAAEAEGPETELEAEGEQTAEATAEASTEATANAAAKAAAEATAAETTLAACEPAACAGEPATAPAPVPAMPAAPVVADPNAVQRDASALTPEFRARLERVIARMQESGHSVRVVETGRSQTRQNALFAQGRTVPGDVVTWTLNSKHTQGRAADLVVDGSYEHGKGYERLMQIAREEGLRTLGAKDPGHVELAGGAVGGAVDATKLAATARVVDVAATGTVAPVAQAADVAQVAQVAQVARVAEVAEVAQPGAARGRRVRGAQEEGAGRDATPAALGGAAAYSSASLAANGSGPGELVAAQRVEGLDRVARISELRDAAASQPMSHMTLRLDNPMGGEDRIRVDLRGLQVGATIDVGNAAQADRLAARVDELRRALEGVGLEPQTVRISSAPRVSEPVESGRAAAAVAAAADDVRRSVSAGSNSDSARSSTSERHQPDHNDHRERRPDTGDSRHRSRREQQGGKR